MLNVGSYDARGQFWLLVTRHNARFDTSQMTRALRATADADTSVAR